MAYEGHPDQRWGHITYSQHGDDLFLVNLFELLGIDKPFYLDLGAHHPTHISNTALLYMRGARGCNVEANPNLIEPFRKYRPEDVTVNVGVGIERGRMPFFMFSEDSGRNTFSHSERDLLIEQGHPVKRTMVVNVMTVNEIFESYLYNVTPNLLTMDLEGLDYEVLMSMTFKPEVICVETRRHESTKMRAMLGHKGYICVVRLVENLIFVRSDLAGKIF